MDFFLRFEGLIVGVATFLIIGVFHPIVIKAEFYWGTKCWFLFLIIGILACIASVFIENKVGSILIGVFAFSCFWSILELFEQKKRVEKGWFPKKTKKKNKI